MNPEQLTEAVTQAVGAAQQIAQTRHHQEIDIPHLWRVLVQPNELASQIYQQAGVDISGLSSVIDQALDNESVVEAYLIMAKA